LSPLWLPHSPTILVIWDSRGIDHVASLLPRPWSRHCHLLDAYMLVWKMICFTMHAVRGKCMVKRMSTKKAVRVLRKGCLICREIQNFQMRDSDPASRHGLRIGGCILAWVLNLCYAPCCLKCVCAAQVCPLHDFLWTYFDPSVHQDISMFLWMTL
jgi:hypothetical protein